MKAVSLEEMEERVGGIFGGCTVAPSSPVLLPQPHPANSLAPGHSQTGVSETCSFPFLFPLMARQIAFRRRTQRRSVAPAPTPDIAFSLELSEELSDVSTYCELSGLPSRWETIVRSGVN